MDNSQMIMHTETEYSSRMTNVKLFTRAIKLNNLLLDASFDDSFKHTLRIINELHRFKARISQDSSFSRYVLKKVDIELHSKYLILLRTAILCSGANASDLSKNEQQYNFEKLVKYINSKEFKTYIRKDKNMKMMLRVYNLLINADRRESAVRDAFLKTYYSLKEFKAMKIKDDMKKDKNSTKLRQAIMDLVRLSFSYTENTDYSVHIFSKFGFPTIVAWLNDDLIEGKLDQCRMNKQLQNYVFSSNV